MSKGDVLFVIVIMELISQIVSISGDPLLDTIFFAIISIISFSVASGFVGFIFDLLGFYDSDLMSGAHWGVRIFIFVSLTFLLVVFSNF